jgi:hypothetical protein
MKLCIGLSDFDFIACSVGLAGYEDNKNLQVNAYSYLVELLFLGLRKKQGCIAEFTMELSTLHATSLQKKQGLATLIFGAFLAKKMPLMT